jgi:hypothetical protein
LNRYVALVFFPEGSRAGTIWSDAKFFFPAPSVLAVVVSLAAARLALPSRAPPLPSLPSPSCPSPNASALLLPRASAPPLLGALHELDLAVLPPSNSPNEIQFRQVKEFVFTAIKASASFYVQIRSVVPLVCSLLISLDVLSSNPIRRKPTFLILYPN